MKPRSASLLHALARTGPLALALAACPSQRATANAPGASAPLEYAVSIPDPASQYVHVAMAVDAPRGRKTRVAMPAWAPGSYLVRDFAKHVYDVRATDGRGRALPVSRIDKQTWEVDHRGRDFTITYLVFAAEVSVRTSHIDDRHASLIGTSVFMYLPGDEDRECVVDLALPDGWSATSALAPAPGAAPTGHARLLASDYDALADAPIELGTPEVRSFDEGGARFEYVLTGADTIAADIDRLTADAQRIVAAYGELMGGFPMRRYLFLVEATARGGGGLEHANSTSMMLRRGMFSSAGGYARAARLAAHEFFHLWNVKRIHDVALGPFDYARENHSTLLWFHEGFTETMEALAMLRAGLTTPGDHVRDLGQRYTRLRARPGRNHDALSQVSFEAWTKGYQPQPNHRNTTVSYYSKGDLVGVALDLELRLRSASNGRTGSLPALFRRLMDSHAAKGLGITPQDVVDAATAEAGEDMGWFFERYVDGREELPLPKLVQRIGVEVEITRPWDGLREGDPAHRRARMYTGLRLESDGEVKDVEPGSPAAQAGFMRGDQLLAVDGHRADSEGRATRWLAQSGPGATVNVAVFREDRLIRLPLTVQENPARAWRFTLVPREQLEPETAALRDAWLATP